MKVSDNERWIAVFFLSVLFILVEIFRLVIFRHYAQDGLLLVIYVLSLATLTAKSTRKKRKMKIDFWDAETRMAITSNLKGKTCRHCEHRKRYSLNAWSNKVVQCCELQPSKRSNSGFKTIKVTDQACENFKQIDK